MKDIKLKGRLVVRVRSTFLPSTNGSFDTVPYVVFSMLVNFDIIPREFCRERRSQIIFSKVQKNDKVIII